MPEADGAFEEVRRLRTLSTLLLDAVERDDVDALVRLSDDFDRGLVALGTYPLNAGHREAIEDLRTVHARIATLLAPRLEAIATDIGTARLARSRLSKLRHDGPIVGDTLMMDT